MIENQSHTNIHTDPLINRIHNQENINVINISLELNKKHFPLFFTHAHKSFSDKSIL